MKALQDNKVQMLAPSLSKMNVFYKDPGDNPWLVFDMPFLFNSTADVASLDKAGIYEEMNATLKDKYAFVFGIWDNGLTDLSTKEAIKKWEDLSDLKVRIQPSEILKEAVKTWGATPRVLAYNELNTGTFYGAVNASTNPPSNMLGSNLMPTQKYLYNTNSAYLGYVVLMNRKFWDGLTPAQRDALTKAIKETRDFQVDAAERDNEFSIERIQNNGLTRVVEMDPAILNRMKRESSKVVSFLSPMQKGYYEKIRAIVAKNAAATKAK
jgi:C4-dicarboxylate-binding protein DctP